MSAPAGNAAIPQDAELTRPYSYFYPPVKDRQYFERFLTDELLGALQKIEHGPTTPDFDREAFQAELEAFDFESPRHLKWVLSWMIQQMLHGIVHVNHPRYFGLFNPAPAFPAQCADRIMAAFNPKLASAVTSPAAVAIKAHTISAVAKRASLSASATGHFTNSGSEPNYTAAICALTQSCPGYVEEGVRVFPGAPAPTQLNTSWKEGPSNLSSLDQSRYLRPLAVMPE